MEGLLARKSFIDLIKPIFHSLFPEGGHQTGITKPSVTSVPQKPHASATPFSRSSQMDQRLKYKVCLQVIAEVKPVFYWDTDYLKIAPLLWHSCMKWYASCSREVDHPAISVNTSILFSENITKCILLLYLLLIILLLYFCRFYP